MCEDENKIRKPDPPSSDPCDCANLCSGPNQKAAVCFNMHDSAELYPKRRGRPWLSGSSNNREVGGSIPTLATQKDW